MWAGSWRQRRAGKQGWPSTGAGCGSISAKSWVASPVQAFIGAWLKLRMHAHVDDLVRHAPYGRIGCPFEHRNIIEIPSKKMLVEYFVWIAPPNAVCRAVHGGIERMVDVFHRLVDILDLLAPG